MHYGLKEKCNPGQPVFGDASLPQYKMPKLMTSLDEALKFRGKCTALEAYF